MSIVLYGSGSSIIVDIEESCARLGLTIAAIVRNVSGSDFGVSGAPTVDADAVTDAHRALPFAVPIFTPAHRLAARDDAVKRGFRRAATVIDPAAILATSATISAGSYVNAGVVIGGASRIGEFVFINRSASIGHHAEIGDFAAIGPGATIAGRVRIGRGAVVSTGAVVLPEVEIGANAVVGAGSVVTSSVPARCLVLGNPACVVKTEYPGYRGLSV
jgi:sugar O-acyltransferase (sialic acid O-acetyltransferase NeuD family)